MQNWDDELNEIMQRKLKQYEKQNDRSTRNFDSNKAIDIPIVLTDNNFKESLNKYPLLVVDFWAPWCGPCRMVSPIIDQLSAELAGKVVFGKLNVDENPAISNSLGIQSIPTLIIFKNGTAIDGLIGAASKFQILSKISGHLQMS